MQNTTSSVKFDYQGTAHWIGAHFNTSWTDHNKTFNSFGRDPAFTATHHVLSAVVTPILCVLGCIGNTINLSVLVYMRLRRLEGIGRESGAFLGLICLAVSDLLFCISLLPRAFVSSSGAFFKTKDFWLYYQAYGTGFVTLFILTGTWLTVTMASLRYAGIVHPFCVRGFDSFKCAKLTYCAVFVLCVIFNLPHFWHYKIRKFPIGANVFYLIDNGFFSDTTIHGRVYIWFKAILGIFIPAIVLTFCNLSLIRALRKSYRVRKQFHVKQQSSNVSQRITLTLIIIVITFVIFVYPSELMDFFSDVIRKDRAKTEVFLLLRSIFNVLQVINFAFNFVLYCAINSHFRNILKGAITCWCSQHRCSCQEKEEPYALFLRRLSKTASTYVSVPRQGTINTAINTV